MKLFAACPEGAESLLADELRQLGADHIRKVNAGVNFQGELEVAYRACLWSRIASRILLPVTDVAAENDTALYNEAKAIRWEKHFFSDNTFAIDVTGTGTGITHSQYAALKLKDAIVDRFREKFDERPSVDTDKPDILIHLFLRGDRARLSIDLSGGGLHKRGYRVDGAAAPLKENLASALLLQAGWPEIAQNGGTLFDPMCGSGTLLIEAAMIAGDVAPGLSHAHFGFTRWKRHDAALWQRLRDEAEERRENGLKQMPAIIGYDRDSRALEAAADNAIAANLDEFIRLARRNLSDMMEPPETEPGLFITNPPYGERLGDVERLRKIYADVGELLRSRFGSWRGAIFTGNPELAAAIGLTPQSSTALKNGALECRLLRYASSRDQSAVRESDDNPLAEPFANRLRKNLKHLRRWAQREGVDCYRLYDQDLPEFAIAVDLYHGKETWVHVQEYQAPRSVDQEKAVVRLHAALSVIPSILAIPRENVFLKVRQKQKGKSQYAKQSSTGRFFEVEESGVRLLVNFTDYLDTGLFLDHRPMRRRIQQEADGKRFLNLFCYTAVASLHAAIGGATQTISVDLSKTYTDWARRNMELNGLNIWDNRVIQANVMEWLRDQRTIGQERFDLIFLDPPTFSSSKKMQGVLDVQRDHVELIRDTLKLLNPDGVLYFSNNFRKFKLDRESLADLTIEEISKETIDEDFKRRSDIHRCWRITR